MTRSSVPLNNRIHRHLKVKKATNFLHLAEEQLIPVVVHEFVQVASGFPIVFVKDTKTGQFIAVAMMGLEPKENLYCSDESWDGTFGPSVLHNHPLSLALIEGEDERPIICINEASELVSALDGESLFDENGEQSEYLKDRAEVLILHVEKNAVTREFVGSLVKQNLLISQDLTVRLDSGEKYEISGIYSVDDKKLSELDKDHFLTLRNAGFLPAIYAQIFSFQQFRRLARRKMAKIGKAN